MSWGLLASRSDSGLQSRTEQVLKRHVTGQTFQKSRPPLFLLPPPRCARVTSVQSAGRVRLSFLADLNLARTRGGEAVNGPTKELPEYCPRRSGAGPSLEGQSFACADSGYFCWTTAHEASSGVPRVPSRSRNCTTKRAEPDRTGGHHPLFQFHDGRLPVLVKFTFLQLSHKLRFESSVGFIYSAH